MKHKATAYYWIDVIIGIAFLFSAVSGLVLFFAPSGGFQGGRNPHYEQTVLLLGHHTWGVVHDWSSIVMIVGVVGHLALHWGWLSRMTRRYLKKALRRNNPAKGDAGANIIAS